MMDGGLADRLKGYAERLQNGEVLDEPGLGADLDDARSEIERQKELLAVGPWDAWRNAEAEIVKARAILESCTSGEMCVDRAIAALGGGEKP
jgi:hypothetical protein